MKFKIVKNLAEGKNLILTDKIKLESILINLIKNALKFTNEGFIECSLSYPDHQIAIYVSDSGPGIAKERQQAIFERFVQADLEITRPHEGSGLGLAIAKEYATMLGGIITVDSEPGKGSRFTVSLPCQIAEEKEEKTESEMPKYVNQVSKRELKQPSHKTILVVEDDSDSYNYLEIILTSRHYQVLHAKNGKMAVDIYREHPEIALILMDLKMPVMDGLEATQRIRQFNTSVPIVAQTAYALSGDREIALDVGCNDYITKPVKRRGLLAKLNCFLED